MEHFSELLLVIQIFSFIHKLLFESCLHLQESALSEEFSPPHTFSSTSPAVDSSSRYSHPYQTLSQSSDEVLHEYTVKHIMELLAWL